MSAARRRFVSLQCGFGAGHEFLGAWQAWRDDPQRSERLVFIAIEEQPLSAEMLRAAHESGDDLAQALIAAWPPLTPDLHRLDFDAGRVQLLLAFGAQHRWLRELVADDVDAFLLPPDAASDKHLIKALTRRAAPGATGVDVRHRAQRPAAREPLAPDARTALILGAGLAGAACAWALARQGVTSTVLDAKAGPAQASSGNPAGLFHGTLNPDDGPHARFNRAAALATPRVLRELALPWMQTGLLRLELARDLPQMQALLEALHLPPDYVQALAAETADAASGLSLRHPAWFYPGGGALPPADYVAALLAAAKAGMQPNSAVARLRRAGSLWQALDAAGQVLAEAPLVVLAGGHEALPLLHELMPGLPLLRQRGQLTHLSQHPGPRLPVAGLGYAIADGAGGLWCGATSQDEDMDPALREADQQHNLAQWARLSNTSEPGPQALAGRVAWRLATPDRLPLVGGIPLPSWDGRADQPRFIPRLPGLALCTAFGSRGITWAALCGEVLAAQVTGAPCPLEASLLDAIDPARFAVRAACRTT